MTNWDNGEYKLMFLKKLVLNGFKSFCDNSEITFVKGISAIVGPNGCGKSNIVDAIKWVVGEQKTKMLRANNMADVIFKGTEHRKGLGRAEVKIILVNENNILKIDYDEVEISRVIFANGENEYYINKNKVRLRDIQELFFDTGIGKSAYSVMEQGKIDMILSNKPEDRRYIIEEAAGITKYKVKKNEALNKLKESEENILRVKDIIEEVKNQYGNVKKQAEKAELFKKYHDREVELEIEINLSRIFKGKNEKEELLKKLENANTELQNIKNKLDGLETGIEDQIKQLNAYEDQKIENQREVFKIQGDINVFNSKNEIFRAQLQQYDLNIKNDSEKVKALEENIGEIDEELDDIEDKRNDLNETVVSLSKDIDFYSKNILSLDEELSGFEKKILEYKDRINNFNLQLENKRKEQKDATSNLVNKFDQTTEVLNIDEQDIINFKANFNNDINFILSNLPNKRAFIDDLLRTGHISSDPNKLLKMLETLRDELKNIEDKVTGINESTKNYLQKTEKFINEIFGPNGLLTTKRNIEHNINEIIDSIKECNAKIDESQLDIIKKRDNKEEFNKTLHNLNINLSTAKEKLNSLENEIKRLISMKKHHETSRDELVQKLAYYKKMINEVSSELKFNEERIAELNVKKENLEKELLNIDEKIQDENNKMSDQQKMIKEMNNVWIDKKNNVEKVNIKLAETTTTVTNIYESFYENYSIDLASHEKDGKYLQNRNYDEIKKELIEVKGNKHSLGSVNLMAIEEAKTLEERYNLLLEQLDDLEKAKKDIFEMIEKINQVSEELFVTTYNEIRENFQKIFRKLFNGGQAEITLTNPKNILETGIDIIAHPPGQKTQSITLLSGGQRTMTAIALMFAAFFVKPSPFCLLDEIDAALDESNIKRFVSLLKENRDNSQFIIITHNSNTISASDVMYGVTQEEQGVSKIVSAKFAEKIN